MIETCQFGLLTSSELLLLSGANALAPPLAYTRRMRGWLLVACLLTIQTREHFGFYRVDCFYVAQCEGLP